MKRTKCGWMLFVTASLALAILSSAGGCQARSEEKSQPKTLQTRIEAARARQEAQQKALRETLRSDPAWRPTHKQVAVIGVEDGSKPVMLNNFCLNGDGNVLACCGSVRPRYVPKGPGQEMKGFTEPAQIKVFSPNGKLLDTWDVDLTPQAIRVHTDGSVFVGGDGRMARLDAGGKLLAMTDWPPKPEGKKEADKKTPPQQRDKAAGSKNEDQQTDDEDSPSVLESLMRALIGGGTTRDRAAERAMAQRSKKITGIAVTDRDLFVASSSGTGYTVYRLDHDFGNPTKIIERLRGCCGQMDVQAKDGQLWVAENGRHRVVRYDRDGKLLAKWGRRDRKKADGFGGCCEPKNLCFGPGGDVYTSESGPPEAVKRFTADGKFVETVALPVFGAGCVRVAVAMSADGSRLFVLNTGKRAIHVFADKQAEIVAAKGTN